MCNFMDNCVLTNETPDWHKLTAENFLEGNVPTLPNTATQNGRGTISSQPSNSFFLNMSYVLTCLEHKDME